MSKLDQPLRLKHGLAAVVAALTLGVVGTMIPMATAGGGGGGNLRYVEGRELTDANSQERHAVLCNSGEKLLAGGARSSAGFANGSGMMLNSSYPIDNRDRDNREDDGWMAKVDVFQNANNQFFEVFAICKS